MKTILAFGIMLLIIGFVDGQPTEIQLNDVISSMQSHVLKYWSFQVNSGASYAINQAITDNSPRSDYHTFGTTPYLELSAEIENNHRFGGYQYEWGQLKQFVSPFSGEAVLETWEDQVNNARHNFCIVQVFPPSNDVLLPFNEVVKDSLAEPGAVKVYSFYGNEGDQFLLNVTRTSGEFHRYNPAFMIYDAPKATLWTSADAPTFSRPINLRRSGVHSLVVFNGRSSDNKYSMNLMKIEPDQNAKQLEMDQGIHDTLEHASYTNFYSFDGEAGDLYRLNISTIDGKYSPAVSLLSPSNGYFEYIYTGNYDYSNEEAKPNYSLDLELKGSGYHLVALSSWRRFEYNIELNEFTNRPPVVSESVFYVDEHAPGWETRVGLFSAYYPDGDPVRHWVESGNESETFFLFGNTYGDKRILVYYNDLLDYETNPSFELQIGTSDDYSDVYTNVTIYLNDINERPSVSDTSFYIDENLSVSSSIGMVSSSDPEGDQLIYKIQGGNGLDAFGINENTGELFVNDSAPLDYETNPSFRIKVLGNDGEFGATGWINIDLRDLNEPPSIADTTFFTNEGLPIGSSIGKIPSFDQEGDQVTYNIISGNDLNTFSINENTGELTINNSTPLEFEPLFELIVKVSDGNSSAQAHVTVVNELVLGTNQSEGLQVHPNPSSGVFNINLAAPSTNAVDVAIYTSSGRKIAMDDLFLERSDSFLILDLADQNRGLYLLNLQTENQSYWLKLMRE